MDNLFEFAKRNDKNLEGIPTKSVGYFKDALSRFVKNKASVVASIIIALIALYALIVPLFLRNVDFRDGYYQKLPPRYTLFYNLGILDGSITSDRLSKKDLIYHYAIGVGAEDFLGTGATLSEGKESRYQPIIKEYNNRGEYFKAKIDCYLDVGFKYVQLTKTEYDKLLSWQEDSGVSVLYPMVDNSPTNVYCFDTTNANYWYKTNSKAHPLLNEKVVSLDDILGGIVPLEDNYLRDSDGNVTYFRMVGGDGSTHNVSYLCRVLYHNYYYYLHDRQPNYILGTDASGYDMALRLARGIRLSLILSISVSVINLVIGAIYGAIEGYFGGAYDMVMERICDVLKGVPFIIVATLFQMHLAKSVGGLVSLLFAFVLTGWIGTAATVRAQFYRFKKSEYVLAARTLGASHLRIMIRHVFPNTLGTVITSSALVIPSVIFSESMLSYLGIVKLGTSTSVSLGSLLSEASGLWTTYPHLMLYPAIVISLLMICFNLFGNGLRDAFNPSLRGVEE